MKTFKKYHSTIQFSGVVKHVRDHCKYHNLPLPTLKFSGSTKLHGTHGTICYNPQGETWFQSRENIVTYEKDNAGFATWGEQNLSIIKEIYSIIISENNLDHDAFYISGEWFGSSIQKGVAIAQLKEKKFGIFKMEFVKFKTKTIMSAEGIEEEIPDNDVFDIDPCNYHSRINTLLSNVVVIDYIVPPVEIEIDFNNPSLMQNRLLEETLKVENECPVGKYFGIASGCGEGLVFSCTEDDYNLPRWKTKGEKHSVSKVKTITELTAAEIASKANALEFVEYACTENRLNQGIAKLGEMGLDVEMKNMGEFLRWLFSDIMKEEIEVLIKSKIAKKDVAPRISDKGRNWFINYIDKTLDLVQ